VGPRKSLPDIVYRSSRYAIFCGGFSRGFVFLKYFSDIVICEDGASVHSAFGGSSFVDHIFHVVGLGAYNQVVQIAASAEIAIVQNDVPIRDLDAGKPDGHNMGIYHAALKPKLPVSARNENCQPRPAFVRTSNVNLAGKP
jgi:hypothetical protein